MTTCPSEELVVDNFAGGGGASTGIEMALGRSVDIAINHDPAAIAMHKANHPKTKHYTEDVWKVDPKEACGGRPVALCWFSPDCKHHSKAKGGKPVSRKIRGLAWVAVKWAKAVRPRVIMLENVEEFQDWGRLDEKGRPDPEHKGETFRRFVGQLEKCGYEVDFRMLRASDYGAPTSRRRFFLIARCDGKRIVWPEPTHGDPDELFARTGYVKPWRTAADILDFSLPCPSIFDSSEEIYRKFGVRAVRPLAEKTLKRIARGVIKYVIQNPEPYIIAGGRAEALIQYHSEKDDETRGQGVESPLMTVDASNRYGLIETFLGKYVGRETREEARNDVKKAAFLTQFNNNSIGQEVDKPLNTITAGFGHFGEVCAFLVKYYGNGENAVPVDEPAPTITARDRMGLVTIKGENYRIVDIGLRMLTPRELFNAQGFPEDYIIDHDAEGAPYPKKEQVARCGNAVCPPIPAALVRANLPEMCREAEG